MMDTLETYAEHILERTLAPWERDYIRNLDKNGYERTAQQMRAAGLEEKRQQLHRQIFGGGNKP